MWRIRKNNLLVNEKDKLFVHKVHLERLLHAKTTIKNKGPEVPYFMKNKLSKKEILRVNENKRCRENSIIYSRLIEINKSFSPYSQIYRPQYCPAFDKKKHFFDKIEKIKDIRSHNKFLFNRFINEKSYYPTKLFFKINSYENYLKENIKRQHFDNPNVKFVTYSQFKNNIVRNMELNRRCRSAKRPTSLVVSRKEDELDPAAELIGLENEGNYSIFQDKSYNTIKMKNNNSNSFYSTNQTSKMKKEFSRCQSALNHKKRKL
jgi:hypothetical protein